MEYPITTRVVRDQTLLNPKLDKDQSWAKFEEPMRGFPANS
jgi:hypothetical protein